MYASFRYYHGNPEFIDLLVQNEDAVKSLISEIDGFRAYYLVRTEDGAGVSVSLFDDKSGTEQSNQAAATWVSENAGDLALTPQVSAGEVVIDF